jgi:uncharacterized protein YecT (DUF1311 family)
VKIFAAACFSIAVLSNCHIAFAQDSGPAPTDPDRQVISTCLDAAWGGHEAPSTCIGKISSPCLAAITEDGADPVVACLQRERSVWDELLNAKYKSVMAASEGDLKAQLKSAQLAWIKTRDQTCDWEDASWSGAPMAVSAYEQCLMYETGFRAVTLWRWAAFERR